MLFRTVLKRFKDSLGCSLESIDCLRRSPLVITLTNQTMPAEEYQVIKCFTCRERKVVVSTNRRPWKLVLIFFFFATSSCFQENQIQRHPHFKPLVLTSSTSFVLNPIFIPFHTLTHHHRHHVAVHLLYRFYLILPLLLLLLLLLFVTHSHHLSLLAHVTLYNTKQNKKKRRKDQR